MVPAHHDEDLAPLEVGSHVRDAGAVEEKFAFLQDVGRGVRGERLELEGEPLPCLLQAPADGVGILGRALGHEPVPVPHLPAVHVDTVALADAHHVRADRDAGVEEDLWPEVGVPPGRGPGGVQHDGRPAGHERLRGDTVDVRVVDDGDITRAQPLGEVLRAGVHPRRPPERAVPCGRLPVALEWVVHPAMLPRPPAAEVLPRAGVPSPTRHRRASAPVHARVRFPSRARRECSGHRPPLSW